VGNYLHEKLQAMPQVKEVRGAGLMLGVALPVSVAAIRKTLLFDKGIFTGSASDLNTIRLLPPLTLNQSQADHFLEAFSSVVALLPV
jgi:acetylornithine aminotransferase